MGFINIFISSPCKLSIKNQQLVMQGESNLKYPLEDINCVVIETLECNITSYCLSAFSSSNIVVYMCDCKHIPNAVLLPLNSYFRQYKILKLQMETGKPLQKQLWQKIVKQKIINQAKCCEFLGFDGTELLTFANETLSNDSNNREAVCASIYFKKIFGKDFTREQENNINAFLNYGYSIVRGMIARSLVAQGFECCIGLHHINELNNFNLADDLIEPFRAIVDLYVNLLSKSLELTPANKREMFKLVNIEVLIGGQKQALSNAIQIVVQNLKKCMELNTSDIELPQLIKIAQHRYE